MMTDENFINFDYGDKLIAQIQDDIKKLKRLLRYTEDPEQTKAIQRQIEWNINVIQKIVGY